MQLDRYDRADRFLAAAGEFLVAREAEHGMRIGPVYTPPQDRGCGYATSLTAFVSKRMLDDGWTYCSSTPMSPTRHRTESTARSATSRSPTR